MGWGGGVGAAKKNGVGPGPSGPYGPRQDLPGKISQPRCPGPIYYIYIYMGECQNHRLPKSKETHTT